MAHYAVLCAFYDSWSRQTVAVEAATPAKAAALAIAKADGPRVNHYDAKSYDPGETYVAGIMELEEVDPEDYAEGANIEELYDTQADEHGDGIVGCNMELVPFAYTETAIVGGPTLVSPVKVEAAIKKLMGLYHVNAIGPGFGSLLPHEIEDTISDALRLLGAPTEQIDDETPMPSSAPRAAIEEARFLRRENMKPMGKELFQALVDEEARR